MTVTQYAADYRCGLALFLSETLPEDGTLVSKHAAD